MDMESEANMRLHALQMANGALGAAPPEKVLAAAEMFLEFLMARTGGAPRKLAA